MRHTIRVVLLAAGLVGSIGPLSAQSPAAPGSDPQNTVEPAPPAPASVQVSADLVDELRKGKTALRRIGWAPGAAELEEGAGAAFSDAIAKLVLAVRQAGGSYRANLYVEPPADQTTADRLGAARFAAVRDALDHAGLPDGVIAAGEVKVDKDARLELVRVGQ